MTTKIFYVLIPKKKGEYYLILKIIELYTFGFRVLFPPQPHAEKDGKKRAFHSLCPKKLSISHIFVARIPFFFSLYSTDNASFILFHYCFQSEQKQEKNDQELEKIHIIDF